ncbi:HsmA family protein [Enterococcus sp. BWR-S5]|uniref:HsmA family protein n=1 Tax=Enterococcus sp. BWR-S5 TaxID=2787714 RepID=UPI001922A3C6|nr:HsmA family protein [Enterococcus sp. BWR-S5]MBL1224048.1 TIGR03987 family protein [Enterococcus sp. BWR-S5]
MDTSLILAIITITLALVFYTIGVFSERHSGELSIKHVLLFGLGLVFDTTGTTIMSSIAKAKSQTSALSLHQVTGVAAIVLMAVHLLWAIYVLFRGTEQSKQTFHRFSLVVWLFWLVPYSAGVIIGMNH